MTMDAILATITAGRQARIQLKIESDKYIKHQNDWCMRDQLLPLTQYLPNGSIQWLLVKPWTSSIGWCGQYCSGALPRPSKMASKVGAWYCCCFVCCCPGSGWGNTERVVAWWRHPEASGVALDMSHQHDVLCIAPAHLQDLQNGLQWRYILMSLSIFSSTITVAKC